MIATIQQIAKKVGVSKQAVSYALNNTPGQVSEATRKRILKTARSLNYQPNWRARSFARRRSQIIGLVYGRPADYIEQSQMVSALVERLAELDHELLLIPAMGPVEKWAHKLRDGRVDGVLITHPMPLGLDQFVAEHRLPAVFMNIRSDLDVPQVYFDDLGGTRQAMEHLLGLGHRRITYFSSPKRHGLHYSNFDREQGYREAMISSGLGDAIEAVTAEYADFADDLRSRAAEARPTALVVYNVHDASRLMMELHARRLHVPEQLSVITFCDEDKRLDMLPALTVMSTPGRLLARHAIDQLMSQIDQPASMHRTTEVLPEHLTVRQSTAMLVQRDLDLVLVRPDSSSGACVALSPNLVPRNSTAPPSGEL